MGAGEALLGGQPIEKTEKTQRQGPPISHVIQVLELTSHALARRQAVSPEAVKLIAKTPIPLIPFRLWRWLFIKTANQHWRQSAASNKVGPEDMLSRPYDDLGKAHAK